jgi:hypothetical protein
MRILLFFMSVVFFDDENFEQRRDKASEGSDGVAAYVERLESML